MLILMLTPFPYTHEPSVFLVRMTGSMLITVWRMILSDISKFASVFVLFLVAYSAATYILLINKHVQEGIPVDKHDNDATNFLIYATKHFWISMGEVMEVNSDPTTLVMFLHLSFVIMSTLLMMNLLIAMMGEAFSSCAIFLLSRLHRCKLCFHA